MLISIKHQALRNLSAVLEAGGSSLKNVVKTNVFVSTMDDFAEMNKVYQSYFKDEPKPVSYFDTFDLLFVNSALVPDLCCCEAATIRYRR